MNKQASRRGAAAIVGLALAGCLFAGTGAASAKVDDGRYVMRATGGVFNPSTAVTVRGNVVTYAAPGRPSYRLRVTRDGGYYDQSPIQRLTFRKHGRSYLIEAYVFGIRSGTATMTRR